MQADLAARFSVDQGETAGVTTVRLEGAWIIREAGYVDSGLRELSQKVGTGDIVIDLSSISRLDTAGALMINRTMRELKGVGCAVATSGGDTAQLELLNTVEKAHPEPIRSQQRSNIFLYILEEVGDNTVKFGREFVDVLGFAGLVLATLARTILKPKRFRLTSTVYHMEETGFNAIPIVSLISFLIGIVLAYQGATSLRTFGAEVFTVDLIAVSVLREIAILLTAIVVAGRSGSAFTAQIGAMKVNEEVDAMRTLGLDPIEILVLPRVIALLIMLPVLGFIGDMMGLFGGMLMSWTVLDISPGMFVERLYQGTDVWHFLVGMTKAPFFAMIIALIGCYEGFRVTGSAASVGQLTTKSVVKSIFMVIIVDALFSIFFSTVGV